MNRLVLLTILALVNACKTQTTPTESSTVKIASGQITSQRPEVGRVGFGCSGTLVESSKTVLTAAHCVGYRSCEEPACGKETFRIDNRSTEYRVVRVKSFFLDSRLTAVRDGQWQMGQNDIALLELETAIPRSIAIPARIARSDPRSSETVSIFGHGITSRCDTNRGTNPKRRITMRFGAENPFTQTGDSGGPTFDRFGQVIRVTSFGSPLTGLSFGACVTCRYDEIMKVIRDWQDKPWAGSLSSNRSSCEAFDDDCQSCLGYKQGLSTCSYDTRTKSCAIRGTLFSGPNIIRHQLACTSNTAPETIAAYSCESADNCRQCLSRSCSWSARDNVCVPYDSRAVRGIDNASRIYAAECCASTGQAVCNRNGRCERYEGENHRNCSADCRESICNNNLVCDAGETYDTCPTDCQVTPSCNNNRICEPEAGEWCKTCGDCSCTASCNRNGACESWLGEDAHSCEQDCGI